MSSLIHLPKRIERLVADASEPLTTGQIAAPAGIGERNARAVRGII